MARRRAPEAPAAYHRLSISPSSTPHFAHRLPAACPQVGQTLPAVISHADVEKGRVFLSFRLAVLHPLQETLESLLALSNPGGGGGGGGGGEDGGKPAAQDLRPALGDMADALRFCEVLAAAPGVEAAEPGVRLQSRASSQTLEVRPCALGKPGRLSEAACRCRGRSRRGAQEGCRVCLEGCAAVRAASAALHQRGGCSFCAPRPKSGEQVYLARDDDVDAVPAAAEAAAAGGAAAAQQYRLVLRKGLCVQEVAVRARLPREEMRALVADTVAELSGER